ncbi:MAG: 1-acyl-sn-glycerol-3-phosphate acyltransferase [Candidatus Obscuribacterales bacterium]|nr:1-acyl-sn-glycerol-3-phosphate acyltransferase [Candidatus Obscuribacterales bacterium]
MSDTQIRVKEGALERFAKLKGKRALVCPNHSNRHDPQAMFFFGQAAKESFNYVAAREVFDWDHGFNGWWLQHIGAYSVVRGAPDRESFKMTKKILAEGKQKLVLFPEGEISRQNDTLLPLETGAAQLAFWAMDELDKQGSSEHIYIAPIALKYTYTGDIKPALTETLARLEAKMSVARPSGSKLYPRLMAVAERLIKALESEYNQEPAKDATLNDRISALRMAILTHMSSYLNVDLPRSDRTLDAVRMLRNKIDDFVYEDEQGLSEYEKELHTEKATEIKGFYKDLDRVVNFVSIYDGYIKEHMTQERFADVLERIEHEVFGKTTIKGPRCILIDVGNPIDLRSYQQEYKTHKKVALQKITDDLSTQMNGMLETLEHERMKTFVE